MGNTEDNVFFKRLAEFDSEIGTVFDVGAHVCGFSKVMANHLPSATYHLFEPRLAFDQDLKAKALANTVGFDHRIVEKAVGKQAGNLPFSVQGQGGVGSSLLIGSPAENQRIVEVPVITLDDYVAENGIEKVDFLKMDIQGGELDALRGARNVLKNVKFLFLETWLVSSYGQKTPHMFEIFDFLRRFGIFPMDFFGGHRNPIGILSHIDVVYYNTNRTKVPQHFYAKLVERMTTGQEPL